MKVQCGDHNTTRAGISVSGTPLIYFFSPDACVSSSINYVYINIQDNRENVGVGLRRPYLRVVGIQVDTDGPGRTTSNDVDPEDEEEFRRVAGRADAYDVIANSIAPSIYGSENIKKAIACLLFGGSRKRLLIILCVLQKRLSD